MTNDLFYRKPLQVHIEGAGPTINRAKKNALNILKETFGYVNEDSLMWDTAEVDVYATSDNGERQPLSWTISCTYIVYVEPGRNLGLSG